MPPVFLGISGHLVPQELLADQWVWRMEYSHSQSIFPQVCFGFNIILYLLIALGKQAPTLE